MTRKIAIVVMICAVAGTALAQTNWEGTAAAARYGEFPPGGFYAASSAFPRNTIVELRDPSTGSTVRVIVVQPSTDPGILMLVSQEAAAELGLGTGSVIQVQARSVTQPDLTAVDPNEDLPFHPDPDINPAASAGNPNEEILSPTSDFEAVAGTPESSQPDRQTEEEEPVVEGPTGEEPNTTPEVSEGDEPEQPSLSVAPVVESAEVESTASTPQRNVIPVPQATPPREEPAPVTQELPVPDVAQEGPTRRIVPIPQSEPAREVVEVPAPVVAESEAPAAPVGPTIVPVPGRRPPVGTLTAEDSVEEPTVDEPVLVETAEAGPPSRTVIPVPSLVPPREEESSIASRETPARRGLASGVSGAGGNLMLRESERPETSFVRREVADTGSDVSVAAPASPRLPEAEAPAVVAPTESPLDRAIEAVSGRMPRGDLFPAPRTGEVLTLFNPPAAPTPADVRSGALAEARPPLEAEEQPIVAEPTGPENPVASELRRLQAPGGALVGRLADARIEDPTYADRITSPSDDEIGELSMTLPGVPTPDVVRPVGEPAVVGETGPETFDRLPSPDEETEGGLAAPGGIDGPAVAGRVDDPDAEFGADLAVAEVVDPETGVRPLESPDESVDVAAIRPRLEDGVERVDDDINPENLVPGDAILALEPADFRPPPLPDADAGIARREGEEEEVVAGVPTPSTEGLGDETGPDFVIRRIEPGEEGVADSGVFPGLPPGPDALARLGADGAPLTAGTREPGMPPGPEELGRLSADEAPVVADTREPGLPARPESPEGLARLGADAEPLSAETREPGMPSGPEELARLGAMEDGVSTDGRAPTQPGGPETGMRAETAGPREPQVGDAAQPSAPGERVVEAQPAVLMDDTANAEWARSNLPLVGKLSSGAYYLQVGAFASPRGAKNAIDVLDQSYPIAVVPVESPNRTVYRLFVGPLSEDERGTMLYWFRARGYKDAFIRKGE